MGEYVVKMDDFRQFKIEDHLESPEGVRYLERIQDMYWVVTEDGCVLQSKMMKLWQCRKSYEPAYYLSRQFEGCSVRFIENLWFKYEN